MRLRDAPCLFLPSVGSTLDEIHRLAADGAPHGTLVVAEEQTAGRGQHGRRWHSPRGGLWLGYLARPRAAPAGGAFALRVGAAVAHALVQYVSSDRAVALKWPNDVLLDGRKVGGVLCEARWHGDRRCWIAVGVGVNLVNALPAELTATAVAAGDLPRDALALAIAERLDATGDAPPSLTQAELDELAGRDAVRGQRLELPVRGVGRGIAADGSLLVETPRGVVAVDQGPLRFA